MIVNYLSLLNINVYLLDTVALGIISNIEIMYQYLKTKSTKILIGVQLL